MKPYAMAIAAAICLVIGCVIGWFVNGWRIESNYAALSLSQRDAYIEQIKSAQAETAIAIEANKTIDSELQAEKKLNAEAAKRRRDNIGSGVERVFVHAKCPASSLPDNSATAGGADATVRAQLDPEIASRAASVTDDGDERTIKFTKLQEYVEKVCLRNTSF